VEELSGMLESFKVRSYTKEGVDSDDPAVWLKDEPSYRGCKKRRTFVPDVLVEIPSIDVEYFRKVAFG
jgi:hypothetical protein